MHPTYRPHVGDRVDVRGWHDHRADTPDAACNSHGSSAKSARRRLCHLAFFSTAVTGGVVRRWRNRLSSARHRDRFAHPGWQRCEKWCVGSRQRAAGARVPSRQRRHPTTAAAGRWSRVIAKKRRGPSPWGNCRSIPSQVPLPPLSRPSRCICFTPYFSAPHPPLRPPNPITL